MPLDARARSDRARIAAKTRWLQARQSTGTATGRNPLYDSFFAKTNPALPDHERHVLAGQALELHMERMRYAARRNREQAAELVRRAEAYEAGLADLGQ